MISVKLLARQVEKFAVDNSPVILTAIGVAGTIGTTFLTAKGTFKAAEQIREESERRYREIPSPGFEAPEFTTKDKVKLIWKNYVPAAGALALTITCVVCATRINTKRIAAMAAAYSLSERAYNEYREKVVEKFNANKERQVRDEIAQDHVNQNPPKESQIIITGHGDVLCFDKPTGRYFRGNMEKIRSVQNDLNAQVNEIGSASLGDLYAALGLKTTPFSDEIGWTTGDLLDIHFSAVLEENGQPVIAIDYYPKALRQGTSAGFPKGCDQDPPF